MLSTVLIDFLEKNAVQYEIVEHSISYTAQEIAEMAHVSGKDFAKTVIVKIDGEAAMVVTQGHRRLDLDVLKQQLGAEEIKMASEFSFEKQFPDCELGAMPPFGNLWNMRVFVDAALTEDEFIAFNAGSHEELIKMSYKDYETLVKPKVIAA
jgi:Ala-tRNA(Pro) deacylase